jgi:hypothetical protein
VSMHGIFAMSKDAGQAVSLLVANDMDAYLINYGGMAKTPKAAPRLYIGEWMDALGLRQVDVVRATGINGGYLNELISGNKKNPGYLMLSGIADALGVSVEALRRKPPSERAIAAARATGAPNVVEVAYAIERGTD